MKDILATRDFIKQFDKTTAVCELPSDFELRYCTTNQKEFDLLDKQPEIILNKDAGNITYINNTDDSIVVVDYENLIQAFPSEINTGKKAPKCCDFLVYSENGHSFIICNELSTSKTKNKWPDARYQFSDTVRSLMNCAETKNAVEGFKNKLCVLSTKIDPIESPDDMVSAFNMPYVIIRKAEQLHWTVVERMGFSISNLIKYEEDDTVLIEVR